MRRVDCEGMLRALFESIAYRLWQVQPEPGDGARAGANGVCTPMRHIQHAAYNATMPSATCLESATCLMQHATLNVAPCTPASNVSGGAAGALARGYRRRAPNCGAPAGPTPWELKESTPPPARCSLRACGRVYHAGACIRNVPPACTRRMRTGAPARAASHASRCSSRPTSHTRTSLPARTATRRRPSPSTWRSDDGRATRLSM